MDRHQETLMWPQARRQSYWLDRSRCSLYPVLEHDAHYDAVVVGAGITGLTTAMRLLEGGLRVAVVEMHRVGQGTTGSSTGHLDTDRDETWAMVIDKFGLESARLMGQACVDAVSLVEQWDREFGLQSDFRRVPAYLYTEDEAGVEEVEQEFESSNRIMIEADLVREQILPFPTLLAVRYPGQARFNPLRYVCGLAESFVQRGGALFEETRVVDVEDGEPCTVVCNRGTITARHVALCTHAPLLGAITTQTRSSPYQSYVITARVTEAIEDALYWDTADPYHYVRHCATDDQQLLMIGGADHRTGENRDTTQCFADLERYTRARYRAVKIEHCWSHEFFEPADGLPYVGLMPGRQATYMATAFSGDGLKFGTIAGVLMADEMLGRPTGELSQILSPSRVKLLASVGMMAEHMGAVAKHQVGDRLRKPDVAEVAEIPPGEGAIVDIDGERTAVFRDEKGYLHAFSPVCRHMGGIVQWNSAEKTWDCPVHGGRYTALGVPIMPPPKDHLKPRDLPVESQT